MTNLRTQIHLAKLMGMLCLILTPQDIFAEQIVHMNVSNEKNKLVLDLLKLALSKSSDEFEFIESINPNANMVRNKEKIRRGDLTVLWAGTSRNLEDELLAIKIPILKGLLGHRIFIIRKEDQDKFSKVSTIDDLTQFKAGQGTFWEDATILNNNNIPIVTTNKFQNLFPMLAGNRFDFFPRAIHEPWVELEEFEQYGLAVEENILLVYPFAMYFFVSRENKPLADKIRSGLEKSIDDGSYDRLFFSNMMIKNALEKANLKQRKIFNLTNPSMPMPSSEKDAKYWLDVSKLEN